MSDHISRKELKQDKVRETLEHGAEAVLSHTRIAAIVAVLSIVAASGYTAWYFYSDRQNTESSAALEDAMKIYSARIRGAGEPLEAGEVSYTDPTQRAQDASLKFMAAAAKYPGTNAGKMARYYSALCMEDLDKQNQALEELKKLSAGGDKELAALALYQIAVINARTGQSEEAIKQFRSLADKSSVFVPRPLALLELAGLLKRIRPQEAATVYQQIKKEFPNTAVSEEADRGLGMLSSKS
ncbi:MAG: hypothetical protein PVS2B2_06060 [Candidatus Acidiferrum sp.]